VPDRPERCAVLLVNLGTPEAPTPGAVRRYLAEFLSDPRVIEAPRWLWLPILYGAILPLRSRRSAHAYGQVWTAAGSPLRVHSEALAARLGEALGQVEVRLAMRYGQPSVSTVLRQLRDDGLRRLLVLPLYPQYSATTTASVADAVAAELAGWRWQPELRTITDYHREAGWVEAMADSIRRHRAAKPGADLLLFSFHGIPQRYVRAGDPYADQCQASARAIATRLGLRDEEWTLSFQSRVGREEWLRPYTDEVLRDLGKRGVAHIDVACPAFAVDCLETLEEIAMQGAEQFRAAGGRRLEYIPALNADDAHVAALAALIRRQGSGWPEFDGPPA
jgi:protoporphyrin/coproporphyrin ferrochelatase